MTSQMKAVTDIVNNFQRIILCYIAVVCFITVTSHFAPTSSASTNDRKNCLEGSGKQAVAACRRALDETPEDLELLLKLGNLLQESGNIKEAVDVFQIAATRYPENKTASHKLAMAKSLKEEQEWLKRRKAKKPAKTVDAKQKTQIRLNRIRCASLKGTIGLAACDEALTVQPDDPVLHHARGDILLQMGRIPEAKTAFARALKLDPGNKSYSQKLAALGGTVSHAPVTTRKSKPKIVYHSKTSHTPSKKRPRPHFLKRRLLSPLL
jgi:predicted Zn-dependent protease